MHIVLALGVVVAAGFADFSGGLATRRAPAIVVSAYAHALGFVFTVLLAWWVGGSPTRSDWLWGSAAGVGSAVGLAAIYYGYANLRVSIVAPVVGVLATAFPVIYSIIRGDEMNGRVGLGILLGLVAIALVSLVRGEAVGDVARSLLFAVIGATGLGFLLIAFGQASDDGGVWIVAPSRVTGFMILALLVRIGGKSPRVEPSVAGLALLVAVLSSSANGMYAVAVTLGDLAVVAVVASMFPAVTVLLARVVFRETIRPVQLVGFAMAAGSVALIAGA